MRSIKIVIFAFIATFSTISVGEPLPEWHAEAEGWCLAFDKSEACIHGSVAVTRIGDGTIGFEVTRGQNTKLYLTFDFSPADTDEKEPVLDAPFEHVGTDTIGSVRVQTYTIALGDAEASRATSYVLVFDSFTLQVSGNRVDAEALARDFSEQWSSKGRPSGSE